MTHAAPRIIAGAWRGKKLHAPPGTDTRPTAARARQAAFDILLHAPWAGGAFMHAANVLDVFAGTGAFGLEALSRGATSAAFIENAKPALDAIKANIAACQAGQRARIIRADALHPPAGTPHGLIFLDPPYAQNLVPRALAALHRAGWLTPGAIIAAELGPDDAFPPDHVLTERQHGKARLIFIKVTAGTALL